jgi:hypothetical protein
MANRKSRNSLRKWRELRDGGIVRRDRSSMREHLSASRYLLGVMPVNELHFFMDANE